MTALDLGAMPDYAAASVAGLAHPVGAGTLSGKRSPRLAGRARADPGERVKYA